MSHYTYSDPSRRMQRVKDDFTANAGPEEVMERVQSALRGENKALTNRYWEALTYFLPNLVYQNPKLSVTTAVPGESKADVVGLKYALETLMEQQRWSSIWKQMAADALAWRGVGMTTEDSIQVPRHMDGQEFLRWDGEKMTIDRAGGMTVPRLNYIPPGDFALDCRAAMCEEAQHMSHRWEEDIDRLAAMADDDESWLKDEIEGMREVRATSGWSDRRIKIYQMYCPFYIDQEAVDNYDGDEDPEDRDLFTGTIYTMAEGINGRDGVDIRKPMLYRGPAGGLYTVLDFVNAPGEKSRMAPFAAAIQQVDNDAVISRALLRSVQAYKRVAVATDVIAQALINAGNDSVVSLKVAAEDLQKQLYELTIGGPSLELLKGYELSDMAADRTFNMSDSLRANAGSDTTATAESLAKSSSDVRLHALADCCAEAMEKMCYTAAWYIEHALDFAITLGDDVVEAGLSALRRGGLDIPRSLKGLDPVNREAVIYTGGDALDRSDETGARHAFSGKTVKVVPMSAQRLSEGLESQRALQTTELVFKTLDAQAMHDDFDGRAFLNDTGAAMNRPGLGKYLPEQPDEGAAPQGGDPLPAGPGPSPLQGRQTGNTQRA